MSKFDELFNNIIAEMNINLTNEATCKPDTMLNQSELNAKKIPMQRKATVIVKSNGNTTGIKYTVDSDTSAEMMADNIKANGGDATIKLSSGVSANQSAQTQDIKNENFISHQKLINTPFDKDKYNKFLEEGIALGIDKVTKYLKQHSDQLSQQFYFNEAPQEEYFIEYALTKYNNEI